MYQRLGITGRWEKVSHVTLPKVYGRKEKVSQVTFSEVWKEEGKVSHVTVSAPAPFCLGGSHISIKMMLLRNANLHLLCSALHCFAALLRIASFCTAWHCYALLCFA